MHDGLQNAEAVVKSVCDRHAEALSAIEDEYIRERVADIRDVGRRLLRNLSGQQPVSEEVGHEHIVIARDLAPSETAALRKDLAVGLAIDMGSPTSHTAVMARAMDIPAVVAMRDVSEQVKQGDEVLIDGNRGVLIVRPTPRQLEEYGRLAETRRSIAKELPALRELPAETVDGHRITLSANIEGVDEVDSVTAHGAEGVGLFRSEYLHLLSSAPVTEEDQNRVYCEVARRLSPQPVIIRTLDIGGDKLMTGAPFLPEPNPFLGCRSIRLSFLHPDYFKAQLRAILRASRYKNVKLMYPMISGVEEVEQANAILGEAMDDLDRAGEEFDRNIDIGAMVEIPSAALTADTIAEHVDFLSIGTNDLVQYTLAVDRVNERVAYLYQPTHPAVLNLIRETIRAGKRNGIWVGLCGEMAADPVLTPLLIGLDLDELSVSPPAAPLVKAVIRRLKFEEARAFADEAVECSSAGEVVRRARELMRRVAPEILELV
ncbi:MAG: phosphoenolpyruvate--protein phosphotransferase [Lentisphaerae bacterium]|nr:phosphoenolpyruvate--protein phosphotransferase [Lentisphaerota bacterium]